MRLVDLTALCALPPQLLSEQNPHLSRLRRGLTVVNLHIIRVKCSLLSPEKLPEISIQVCIYRKHILVQSLQMTEQHFKTK